MSILRVITAVVALSGAMAAGPELAQAAPATRATAATPAVEDFVAERVQRLAPGVALNFSVFGSERGAVVVYIEGVPALVDLREVQPGVYEGTHVIAAGDRLRADSQVVATLQRGGQVVRATLAEPLVISSAPLPWDERRGDVLASSARPVPIANVALERESATRAARTEGPQRLGAPVPPDTAALRCEGCAVVESIRVVEAPAPDDVPGRITRALEDHRSRVLGLLDAIGLPFAGREKQRLAERAMEYEVSLRMPDGSVVARRYGTRPAFQIGDAVPLPSPRARVAAAAAADS